ncbi:MAG TPA: Ig-like domain-containing protein [Longimicrobiales bacterium]|nr:Ig-like domain-containing protein [Longimicrobiales bacterium]
MIPGRFLIVVPAIVSACSGCGPGDGPESIVEPQIVQSVDVVPPNATIVVGQSIQFVATARDAGGRPVDGQEFTWSTSDPAVVSIDPDGRATGVTAGTVTVTARTADMPGSATVDVSDVPHAEGDINIDTGIVHQTMIGWDVVPFAGHWECGDTFHNTELYNRYKDAVLDMIVEMGINRVRAELRTSAENPRDAWTEFRNGQIGYSEYRQVWYNAVNDNADPNVINPDGFHFSELDTHIEMVINPLRERLQAKGEKLYIVINVIHGARTDPFQHRHDPDEYAEFLLAAFQHVEQKWGWIPDAIEVINEPDLGNRWTSAQIGNALVATGNRLKAAGYNPDFVAPSGAGMDDSIVYFNEMIGMPGVAQYLTEFSYHRYNGVSDANLNTIGQLSKQYAVGTAMLERIGSGYEDLHKDLTIAHNTSWEQYAIAGCNPGDPGGRHVLIDISDEMNPRPRLASRSHFLRLYFKWVKPGAVRIGATSGNGQLAPIAYINRDGRYTVIVKATDGNTFTIGGLPRGTYGIAYATGPNDRTPNDTGDLADVQIGPGEALSTSIGGRGIITIYGKN